MRVVYTVYVQRNEELKKAKTYYLDAGLQSALTARPLRKCHHQAPPPSDSSNSAAVSASLAQHSAQPPVLASSNSKTSPSHHSLTSRPTQRSSPPNSSCSAHPPPPHPPLRSEGGRSGARLWGTFAAGADVDTACLVRGHGSLVSCCVCGWGLLRGRGTRAYIVQWKQRRRQKKTHPEEESRGNDPAAATRRPSMMAGAAATQSGVWLRKGRQASTPNPHSSSGVISERWGSQWEEGN